MSAVLLKLYTWSICEICKNTWIAYLSIGVRITMIRCVVYLLRIFKMFHGLMNNPVYNGYNLVNFSLNAADTEMDRGI
jgi:hypothetical protein